MNRAYVLYQMVRADFLERVRRYSFLLTLAFAAYLAWSAATGLIVLRLDEYRGVFNSAWVGSMMTLVSTMFISLVGFYIVKNAILRDEQTRVGRILASTPMSRVFYTLAKALSNFAVLVLMLAVLAGSALFMQFARAEDPHYHLATLLAPFLWAGIPAMAVTAAVAVLFETLPVLRGGVGNVIYFFVWTAAFAVSDKTGSDDFAGLFVIARSMQETLKKVNPAYKGDFALNIGENGLVTKRFLWTGVDWTPTIILHRLLWILAALATAMVAAVFFHRFDPAREWGRKKQAEAQPSAATSEATSASVAKLSQPVRLTPLARRQGGSRFFTLVVSEMRLMLKGQHWWWYAGAAGIVIGSMVSPLADSRGAWLVAAWIWPVLIWSQMGTREARYNVQSLIFSSERALGRQLPAVWAAGVLVAVATGAGVGIRLLLAGDWPGVFAWIAGVLFIPSLALALGVLSGRSKAFEALYTVWWYIGPLHHVPGADFAGTTAASSSPAAYLLAATALLAAAYAGRRAKLGYA